MAKEQFQQELNAMLEKGSGSLSLAQVLDGLTELIGRHGDTFQKVTNSYRLIATDSGVARAFALENGHYQPLAENEPADVTITGKEQHLLAIFNKQLKPAMALLTGKLKVQGNMGALTTLASYL